MALQFHETTHSCLRSVLREVQNMEQTQELRIPEGMPGAERVVSAWGQAVMRSKDWHGTGISLSAGMLVWVLYISEEGNTECAQGWIPFQFHWELPRSCPDGEVRILCLPRYVDARSVSAGKILVRAGMAALAEGWCPDALKTFCPEAVPEDVQLLQVSYPVQLPKEAGEKTFRLEETLTLPGSAPAARRLICCRLNPSVTDKKVLADKVVFRGGGNLHMVYESEDGKLHSWDFELPFSQFGELKNSYSADARVDVRLMPTDLELETDPNGEFQLKSGLTAQYLVDDREMLELTEDAYSPHRELKLEREVLETPALLDSRQENIYGEQTLPGQADLVVDAQLLPDFPRQRRDGDTLTLDMPGTVQTLYYDSSGTLQSAAGRWEGTLSLPADGDSSVSAMPVPGAEVQTIPAGDSMTVKAAVPIHLRFSAGKGIPMVTGMEPGQTAAPDPGRPSLVIRRAGDRRLWDLAKLSGSTVDAIRSANDLTEEPDPTRLLLIPIL